MAVNPLTRRPKARLPLSRTFTDDDWTFTLTFARPGVLENCVAHDRGEELVLRYLGDEDGKKDPLPFLLADGTILTGLSKTSIANAAAYESMQPHGAGERYSAEQFIAFQGVLSDECWAQVSTFAQEVRRGSTQVPPTFGGATETSSESASVTPDDTPST